MSRPARHRAHLAFFVSAWLLMIFAGITSADIGVRPFGYVTSMIVTIGLWLTLAPAIGRDRPHRQGQEGLTSPRDLADRRNRVRRGPLLAD